MCDGPTDGRTDRRTDRPTDRRTDTPSYRDARTHLKTTSDQDLDRLPSNLASNINVFRGFNKNVACNMHISSVSMKSRLLLLKTGIMMQMNVKFSILRATGRAELAQTSNKGHCFAILNPFSHSFSSFRSRACMVCM